MKFDGAQAAVLMAKKREENPVDSWGKDDWEMAMRMGGALTTSDLSQMDGDVMLEM